MKKLLHGLVLALLSTVLLTGSAALAEPKAKGPKAQWTNGQPPGFSNTQGQKKGWQGNTAPRGWTAGKGQKKGWDGQTAPKGINKKQQLQ